VWFGTPILNIRFWEYNIKVPGTSIVLLGFVFVKHIAPYILQQNGQQKVKNVFRNGSLPVTSGSVMFISEGT
jgi:hypothetical protein